MLSLRNKVIAITGIGSPDNPKGNGRATAELFSLQGGIIEGLDIEEINTKGKHLKFFVTGGYITIPSTPSSRFWRHKTRRFIRRYMDNF